MAIITDDYIKIRNAMANGARTIEDIENMTNITVEDDNHAQEIQAILENACRCKNVSVEEVAKAVKNGADTVEKVSEATTAGTGCGRCKGLINNIIDNNR